MSRLKLNLPSSPVLPGVAVGVVVLFMALLAVFYGATQTVAADNMAIRQVYVGPGKGLQEKVLAPGLHLVIPGYERLHLFPRDLQLIELNDDEHSGLSQDVLGAPSVRIQTSDGYQVTVDVTVLYRIADPFVVVSKVGFGRAYEDKIVVKRSDRILRQYLGSLDAEDFFDDRMRMRTGEAAREHLERDLAEWGIQVWGVLVRQYRYDDRFQSIIEARKIEDQRVFKNVAERQREERQAHKNEVMATWAAEISVLNQEGATRIREIVASADRYHREKMAEGKKAVQLAEADGAKWERQALEAAGASNLVGIEMAEALSGTEVIVVSTTGPNSMNPLDLDKLLRGW
jgi:regulator of protease activity HflC (stomatin/prohibitin superfamily)